MVRPTTRSQARDDTETPEPAHRHESFSVFVDEEDALQERRITKKDFHEWVDKNPDELFAMICRREADHVLRTQDQENQISAMQDRNIEMQEKYSDALAQVEASKARVQDLEKERDEFARHATRLAISASATVETSSARADVTETARHSKHVKITDPPALTDGKEPTYEEWKIGMEAVIDANPDRFSTPEVRKAYILGRTDSRARRLLLPRMGADSANRYKDSKDMLEHLKEIFANPNEKFIAAEKLRRFFMRNSDSFHDFLAEFHYLADKSGVSTEAMREELYNRLTPKLQEMTFITWSNPQGTFQELTECAARAASTLETIQSRQRGGRFGRSSTSTSITLSGSNKQGGSSSTTPTVKREETEQPGRRIPNQERRCFNCQQIGHIARECPQKKPATELKGMEQEEHKDEDSENATT